MVDLSVQQRLLLIAMRPGRTYDRLCDPRRTTAQTIERLLRLGLVEQEDPQSVSRWSYRLTAYGVRTRKLLLANALAEVPSP